jgi:Mn-containing catalase
LDQVQKTNGLLNQPISGGEREMGVIEQMNKELSQQRSEEIKSKIPSGENQWSEYSGR